MGGSLNAAGASREAGTPGGRGTALVSTASRGGSMVMAGWQQVQVEGSLVQWPGAGEGTQSAQAMAAGEEEPLGLPGWSFSSLNQ